MVEVHYHQQKSVWTVKQIVLYLIEMEVIGERQEFPGKNIGKLVSDDNGLTRRGGNYLLSWKLSLLLNP